MENNLHVRFYAFDFKSCDPSFWNSTTDSTSFFTADNCADAEDGPPTFHQVQRNVINFLLDDDALNNAAIELDLQDLATDSEDSDVATVDDNDADSL